MAIIKLTGNRQDIISLVVRRRAGLFRVTSDAVCVTSDNRQDAVFSALLAELLRFRAFRRAIRERLGVALD